MIAKSTIIQLSLLRAVVSILALAAFTSTIYSQESLKIATVDMSKTFESYWKTTLSNKQIKERETDFNKIEQGMVDDIKLIQEEYSRLVQSAQDPANAASKREEDSKQARLKAAANDRSLRSLTEYRQNKQRTMGEMRARLSKARVDEIKEIISAKAKQGSYDLVVNSAQNDAALVLYTVGKNDLTKEVIEELNKEAPEEYRTKKPTLAVPEPPLGK
ncbi:MAG: OmpH family outer membrane protein [Limisphaerales bacterium]|mgnify:FL=1|nr:MAG: OmpH family outer membrane protein [Limisphaerales bacterium]